VTGPSVQGGTEAHGLTTALAPISVAAHAAGQELSLGRRIMDISLVDLTIEIIFGAIGGYIAGTAIKT